MANPLRLALRFFSRVYGAWVGCFSRTDAFFPTSDFRWIPELESHWTEIRDELVPLIERRGLPRLFDVLPGETAIADDRWKAFIFVVWGREVEENCLRCPRTAELLRGVPGMTTAMFSIFEGHNHVPPHRGPFRGVLRYHLGLIIPEPIGTARLRVLDETRAWEPGQSLVFDDTYEHEAWNDSDRPRVVLFLDIKRPLPVPVRWINDAMMFALSRLIIWPSARLGQAGTK